MPGGEHGRELQSLVGSFLSSDDLQCRRLIWQVHFSHEGWVFLFFHTCSYHLVQVLVEWLRLVSRSTNQSSARQSVPQRQGEEVDQFGGNFCVTFCMQKNQMAEKILKYGLNEYIN